jgi:hypothetical protein
VNEERNIVSSIPEALPTPLPTPRHQLRRAESESRPLIDRGTALELGVAIVVAWIVLALIGVLGEHVGPTTVPINSLYSRE